MKRRRRGGDAVICCSLRPRPLRRCCCIARLFGSINWWLWQAGPLIWNSARPACEREGGLVSGYKDIAAPLPLRPWPSRANTTAYHWLVLHSLPQCSFWQPPFCYSPFLFIHLRTFCAWSRNNYKIAHNFYIRCHVHTGDTISLYTALTPKLGRGGSKVLLGQSFIGGLSSWPAGLTNLIKAPHRGPTHCSKFWLQVFLLTHIFLDKLLLSVQRISLLRPHSAKHLTVHFKLMQLIGLLAAY